MKSINIQAITEIGCCVYTSVKLPEDYTMNQMVNEVKRLGYTSFRIIETGMRFVKVN